MIANSAAYILSKYFALYQITPSFVAIWK